MIGTALLTAAAITFVVALAVAFAGSARVLNILDYTRVSDPAAVNRAVGLRLLALPALLGALALFAWRWPDFAIIAAVVSVLVPIGVIGWVVGSSPHTGGGL